MSRGVRISGNEALIRLALTRYMILSTAMTIYITYYEQSIIFEGKRRTFASRVSPRLHAARKHVTLTQKLQDFN